MGPRGTQQCEGCRRSLPKWWNDPWCPACPPAPVADEPVASTDAFPPDPTALSWGPPTPPLAFGAADGQPASSAGGVGLSSSTSRPRRFAGLTRLLGRRLTVRLLCAAVALAVAGIGAVARGMDRNADVSSPARGVVQEPCAQYRALLERADQGRGEDFVAWVAANQATFDEAARLDPDLAAAAASVRSIQTHYANRAAGAGTLPSDQLLTLDDGLVDACLKGPGRA